MGKTVPAELAGYTPTASDERNKPLPVDDPAEFDKLPGGQREALVEWITARFQPAARVYDGATSYGMKHWFEESEGGFYVTNGQFKGAMLRAGFEPTNPHEKNWCYRVGSAALCYGRLWPKGYAEESQHCTRKAHLDSGLCSYHEDREADGKPINEQSEGFAEARTNAITLKEFLAGRGRR